MPAWLFLLAGPLIWAAHFGAIYAISSLSFVIAGEATLISRGMIVIAGIIAAVACVWITLRAFRRQDGGPLDTFWRGIAGFGALIALFGVALETLPAFAL